MKQVIKGQSAKRPFEPLLKQWIQVVADYGEWWKWEKCSWWQRERPAVSIFSGAVWRIKGMLLEEGRAQKVSHAKMSYNGRCDLTFGLPGAKGRRFNFEAEAKHIWCNIDRPVETAIRQSTTKLERAWQDARRLKQCENPLGLLFVSFAITGTPHVPEARRKRVRPIRDQWIKNFLAHFKDQPNLHLAWFVSTSEEHIDCPGCAVLIRHGDTLQRD